LTDKKKESTMTARENSPLLRDDILRLEEKIDGIMKYLMNLTERMVAVEQRPILRQPCEGLLNHLAEHKSFQRDWRNALIQLIVGLLIVSLSGLAGYLFRVKQELKKDANAMAGDIKYGLAYCDSL